MKKLALFLLTSSAAFAQTSPLAELLALARQGPAAPGLKDGIAKTLSARGGQRSDNRGHGYSNSFRR